MKTRTLILTIAICPMMMLAFGCGAASQAPPPEVFKPTHDSLIQYGVPEWYEDAKFGIYMHWGPFSVPAFQTEWYPTRMYQEGNEINLHHIENWGPLDKFGYKDFIPMLTAEKWDPDYFAALFKEAGAQYVAAPAVHHDGFAMWDSKVIPFNAGVMGPKRDTVGELIGAARKIGLKAGLATHYGRHWKYYTFRPEYDTWDREYEGLYGRRRADDDDPLPEDAEHWKDVMREVIDNYQPDYIFVDGGVIDASLKFGKPYFTDAMYEIVAYYYNRSRQWEKDIVITYKREVMDPHEAVEDFERSGIDYVRQTKWQSDDKLTKTGWCYVKDTEFWSVDYIIGNLMDIVSKNGNLLLSIGPKPDGTIRPEEVVRLKAMGKWLKTNGEAVYATKPWRIFGEGESVPIDSAHNPKAKKAGKTTMGPESVRFTRKDNVLYATIFDWPESGRFTIKSITSNNPVSKAGIKEITLLGSNEKIRHRLTNNGLALRLPKQKQGEHAYVFKIQAKGDLSME